MRISDWSSDVCSSDLPHYVYPLPIKQALVFHDYTRCWIGTTTLVGTKKFHLNWNINDRGGHKINHRRSEEHTSELQSLMRTSYAVFCLKKKNITHPEINNYMSLTTTYYPSTPQ